MWTPAYLEVDKELGVLSSDVPDFHHLGPRAGLLQLRDLESVRLLALALAQLLLRRLLVIALLLLLLILRRSHAFSHQEMPSQISHARTSRTPALCSVC